MTGAEEYGVKDVNVSGTVVWLSMSYLEDGQ